MLGKRSLYFKVPRLEGRGFLFITTLVIGALIGASALSVLASGTWTGPTVLPPAGNVAAPLNIGALLQEKAGSLLLDGGLGVLGKSILTGGVSIGTTSDPIGWSALDVNGDVSIRGSQAKEAVLTSEAGNKGMEIKARGGEHPDLFVSTSGNIGIGTSTPSASLDVDGTLKLSGAAMSPGAGKVLTSDAVGNATWQVGNVGVGGSGSGSGGSNLTSTYGTLCGLSNVGDFGAVEDVSVCQNTYPRTSCPAGYAQVAIRITSTIDCDQGKHCNNTGISGAHMYTCSNVVRP